ncbi:uncharacterized protein LOC106060688 isoform X5 [Biomphalaria glabrata]|uniref:Uncharacterized protein LOC106060688 isoform X5 n=1 Tax=Biomphalaria glabrata TaxID=6526 RepID=A0A9W3BHI7_BIOGL|nr:uncharacterized protein LOC106060688 isoform X5 [Biomphalaria glabrata]
MDYFALFLCAGCVVLSGLVLNVESCLEQSRECVRLSQFQSIVDDQMPGNCKNLTKAKSCYDKVLRECKSANESRMISMARNSTEFQYNTYCFFDISQAGLQEGNQCARVMQTEEMRLDQLDQLCPKLSSALSCLNAAIATCTSDAERSNLNSGKMGLEQQYNTLCSGGCSIADIMRCSPNNTDQLSIVNEETCKAVRQMKVCIAEVRAKCTQEDIKAQIDMQIQGLEQMLPQCPNTTSEPKKKKKVKIPKIKKIKKTKKIKNLKKDEKEDRKKKEETTKTKVFVVTESPTSQVSSLSEGTINLTVMFCIICT